jgi:predicted nucleic acid-binding protein
MILLDSNILLRLAQPDHPLYRVSADAVNLLNSRERQLIAIAPQALYEMYVVATRPVEVNGLGWSPSDAHNELLKMKRVFRLLPETRTIYEIWEGLIKDRAIAGKPAHDARMVAMMLLHDVKQLLTFNVDDFQRFSEITVRHPSDLLGLPRT